jgi:hypothetical protein
MDIFTDAMNLLQEERATQRRARTNLIDSEAGLLHWMREWQSWKPQHDRAFCRQTVRQYIKQIRRHRRELAWAEQHVARAHLAYEAARAVWGVGLRRPA